MFFKKSTPPPAAPSAEERAAIARQQQTSKLRQALETDPAFQLTTLDGLGWICPYTGTVVKAPFGWQDQALAHLLSTQPWTKTQKKSLDQLKAVRWLHWLRQQIPDEHRLGIFGADKRWLNPFTGQWERLQRMHHELTDDCVKDIAVALSRCEAAASMQLLPSSKLESIASRREAEAARSEISLEAGARATVRTSGEATRTNLALGGHPDNDLRRAAGIIHQMLAPMPDIPGYGLVVHYEPHSSVGGDFYECAKLNDGRTLLMVGDVTGHGVQGAMVVVAALKGLRHVLKQIQDPVEILAHLGDDLKDDLLPGQFITVFMAVLDPSTHELTCYSAGHHAAVRSGTARDAVLERIVAKGPALGLVPSSILCKTIKPAKVRLEPGDQVVLWTDGLTENPNDEKEEFGDWRAMGAAISCVEKGVDEVVAQMVAESRTWGKAHFSDDCTVLGLQRLPLTETSG